MAELNGEFSYRAPDDSVKSHVNDRKHLSDQYVYFH